MSLPSPSEMNALQGLYISTNGVNWTWSTDYTEYGYPWYNSTNPCNSTYPWQGVTCTNISSTASTIIELSLMGRNLNGTLLASIGDLVNLTQFNLSYNFLSGSIPTRVDEGYERILS